jgi:hypothetical protein
VKSSWAGGLVGQSRTEPRARSRQCLEVVE